MDALASRFFCVYALERMIIPMIRLRVFQVSLYPSLLSVHSMVGSGASSCYRCVGMMRAILLLIIGQEACYASFVRWSV